MLPAFVPRILIAEVQFAPNSYCSRGMAGGQKRGGRPSSGGCGPKNKNSEAKVCRMSLEPGTACRPKRKPAKDRERIDRSTGGARFFKVGGDERRLAPPRRSSLWRIHCLLHHPRSIPRDSPRRCVRQMLRI